MVLASMAIKYTQASCGGGYSAGHSAFFPGAVWGRGAVRVRGRRARHDALWSGVRRRVRCAG